MTQESRKENSLAPDPRSWQVQERLQQQLNEKPRTLFTMALPMSISSV